MSPALPCFISYGTEYVYRPAGYRIPEAGELYIAKDGHIKVANKISRPSFPVLIVRILNSKDDFEGAAHAD